LLSGILCHYPDYEIIFVDDASKDSTMEVVKEIRKKDQCVRIIELVKHAGQYIALFIGFKCCKGQIVINLDDDAFDEIICIPKFIEKIEEGEDIVLGWRKVNTRSLPRMILSLLFNLIISLIIGKRMHDIGSSLKARNRKVVDRIISLGDLSGFLKYYKYYKFSEIKIPHKQYSQFTSRYNNLKLIQAGLSILRSNFFKKSQRLPNASEIFLELT
jgi:glycosyltransferase involved in cell wall biosynthesis